MPTAPQAASAGPSRRALLALSFLLGRVVTAPNPAAAQADPLARYRWKARVLAVVASDPESPALAEQKRQLLAADPSERDLVLVQGLAASPEAKALRARLGVGNASFRAVLVGKDGEAKLTASAPIGARELIAVIDSMPMRQDEMRRRSQPRS